MQSCEHLGVHLDAQGELLGLVAQRQRLEHAQPRAYGPLHDLALQGEDALQQRLGRRRTARDVDVHRNHVIHAGDHRVDVAVMVAGIGATAHRDDPLRVGHLVVEPADARRHLDRHRAGDEHHVGLARGGPQDHAEAVEVEAAGEGGHHLDGAAGQPEGQRPEARFLRPVEQRVRLEHARRRRRGSAPPLRRSPRGRCRSFLVGHARVPFYLRPAQVALAPGVGPAQDQHAPGRSPWPRSEQGPTSRRLWTQTNRKAASASNRMNSRASRKNPTGVLRQADPKGPRRTRRSRASRRGCSRTRWRSRAATAIRPAAQGNADHGVDRQADVGSGLDTLLPLEDPRCYQDRPGEARVFGPGSC